MSIRLKFIIMFTVVATIPLLLVGALTFHNYTDTLEANRLVQMQNIADFKVERIEAFFASLKNDIETAQTYYNIRRNLPVLTRLADNPENAEFAAAKKMLDGQLQPVQTVLGLSDIMLVNPQGRVVYSSNPEHYPKDFSKPLLDPEQKAFEEGKSRIFFSDIFYKKNQVDKTVMQVTAPAYDFNNIFIGVIALEVDARSVYKIIEDVTGLGETGEVLIGKKTGGQIVYLNPLRHDPNAALNRTIDVGSEIGRPIQEAIQGKTGAGQLLDYRGEKVIAAWQYIPSLDWGMVAKIDAKEAFADVTNLGRLMLLILVIIFVLSGITAFSIAQSISEPIRRLSKGAEIIGRGNLDYKIGSNQKDEIGQLARSFDKMTSDLKQTTASFEELTIEVRERKKAEETILREKNLTDSIIDSLPGVFYLFDEQGKFIRWNKNFEKVAGLSSEEMSKTNPVDLFVSEDRQLIAERIREVFEKGQSTAEGRLQSKSGAAVPHFFTGKLVQFDHKPCLVGMGIDITERKQAEDALKESEFFYRQTLESIPGMVFTTRPDGYCDYQSQQWVDFTGVPMKEHLGDGWNKLLHPDDRPRAFAAWRDAVEGRSPYDLEYRVRRHDGQYQWFKVRGAPIRDAEGKIVRWFGVAANIEEIKQVQEELKKSRDELEIRVQERTKELTVEVTERKKAEENVTAERQRFYDVLETLPVYVCLLTPEYNMPFANKVFREWFGYRSDKKCYEFLFGRKEPCENCETYLVLKTHQPQRWQWTGPNGRNYDIYDFPFKDTDGSQLILEMGIDITEQKQAQNALRSASLYTRGLIEAALDPLVTIDSEGKITDVNEATIKATGVSRQQLVGTDFSNYFTEPLKAREGYQKVFADGFVTDYPLTIRHNNGSLTDVLYNAAVYKNEAGEIQGVFAAARDVTEKRAAEAELEKYRLHLEELVNQRTEELARSNKDLEQFAYVASHDLQEPLRAVAGFVELLRRNLTDSLDAKTGEYMNFTVDGVMRMRALINGLLEYSRVGTQGKKPKETNSKKALDEAMEFLRTSIKETDAQITSKDLPVVYFDEIQLTQLLQNLIGNAIKFRSEKAPRIHIEAARQDNCWRFAVTDNSIGIEPQYSERIFQIFQRLHGREKYSGTGIGLAICKKIVERHNGKIWVESKPGSGSTFYFTIPDKGEIK